jgi:hypothetical protein
MSAATRTSSASQITTGARYALIATAWLFALGGVVQVFLAGLSVFDSPTYWEDHKNMGNTIWLLTFLMPILALVGRVGIPRIVQSFLLFVLFMLQYAFANAGTGWVAALHAVNALVLIGMAGNLGSQTLDLVRSRRQAGAAQPAVRSERVLGERMTDSGRESSVIGHE